MKTYLVVSSILNLIVVFIYSCFLNDLKKENGRLWEELREQYDIIEDVMERQKKKFLCEINIDAKIEKNRVFRIDKKGEYRYYRGVSMTTKEKLNIGDVVKVIDRGYYKIEQIYDITNKNIEYIVEEI